MDWFKHKTGSHEDPDISDAEDEFGDSGYAIFFKTLEVYGREYRRLKDGWLDLSKKKLCRNLRKKWKRTELVLNFYRKRGRILLEVNEKRIRFKIPKFIELVSNWTKRQDDLPTEGPTEEPTEEPQPIEEEEEEEVDYIESSNEDSKGGCPHKKIVELYHKILPSLPTVRIWTETQQKYLRARWREDKSRQNLEWWMQYFEFIGQSEFLMGNKTDFRASLEWVVRPSNMGKILNGHYHSGNKHAGVLEWLRKK